jgi:hypothetical protein
VEAEPRPSTSQLLPGRQLHGEAEVGELEESLVVQQDVLGLQVAMDDVPGVEVLDGLQQSPHQAPGRHRQMKPKSSIGFSFVEMQMGLDWRGGLCNWAINQNDC